MASTINADNGVVSGSSGLKSTADTSGVLALQSNGTTGLTLNTDLSVTFAGAQTLSAGTANGVTYLNGSKVLTSGSALQFDGTNLGLGVTPSAWYSNAKAFQIGNGSSLWSSANTNANLSQNLYLDATATYRWITANPATNFSQSNGAFSWQLAAGTPSAGGAIGSFNTYMTLDASGNLGIGTTTPNTVGYGGAVLGLYGGSNTGGNVWLTSDATAAGNRTGRIGFGTEGNSTNKETARVWSVIAGSTAGNVGGDLLFSTKPDGGALTERFRIGSAGQLGIGGATYGTSGQVLTSGGSSAAPTWSTPSAGALVYLSTQTVSGTPATVDFTSGISSTYDEYMVLFDNVKSSVNNNELNIRLYKSGAFQTTGYNYQYAEARNSTTSSLSGAGGGAAAFVQLNSGNTSATATFQSGRIWLYNVNTATANACMVITQTAGMGGTIAENYVSQAAGSQNTAAVVTGIRFYWGSGANFSSGTFRLYGVAKA